MTRRRILLVEDEPGLLRTLVDLFVSAGYDVESASDGLEGQEMALRKTFDLIVLDVMLPSRTGFDICRQVRKSGIDVPIMMLTARSELNNKVQGFKAGADDYLTKPFEAPELLVRVEALFRRAATPIRTRLTTYEFAGIRVNFDKAKLARNGHTTSLSERECRLLQYLIECNGAVVSRDELLREVWGYSAAPLTRTVDVHIAWLRQKIEDDPAQPQFILTVHGQGYRFSSADNRNETGGK